MPQVSLPLPVHTNRDRGHLPQPSRRNTITTVPAIRYAATCVVFCDLQASFSYFTISELEDVITGKFLRSILFRAPMRQYMLVIHESSRHKWATRRQNASESEGRVAQEVYVWLGAGGARALQLTDLANALADDSLTRNPDALRQIMLTYRDIVQEGIFDRSTGTVN
jgi:hypothetical protein